MELKMMFVIYVVSDITAQYDGKSEGPPKGHERSFRDSTMSV